MLDIGNKLFGKCLSEKNFSVKIAPLYGEYLWLPMKLKEDKGTITFDVKGQNDFLLCLAQEDLKVKDLENDIYEIAFGAWENKSIEIRIKSLGKAAASITTKKKTKLKSSVLPTRRFTSYWFDFDHGLIQIGKGNVSGKNILLEWKDPFPWVGTRFIGVGTWDVPIEVRNIRLKNAISVDEEGEYYEKKEKPV